MGRKTRIIQYSATHTFNLRRKKWHVHMEQNLWYKAEKRDNTDVSTPPEPDMVGSLPPPTTLPISSASSTLPSPRYASPDHHEDDHSDRAFITLLRNSRATFDIILLIPRRH